MDLTGLVDAILILTLLGYLGFGVAVGLVRSLFTLGGVLAGGVVAYLLIPLVAAWFPIPTLRLIAVFVVGFGMLALGQWVGSRVGFAVRQAMDETVLTVPDRVLGGVVGVTVTALVVSLLGGAVLALGVPVLSPAVAQSAVIRTIDDLTPDPVKDALAHARSFALHDGLPTIISAIQGSAPEVPADAADTPELREALRSVVRVSGPAYQCGHNQTGSGFVVARDRVITNAHVVAGVAEPVVEAPGHQAVVGTVVFFDPQHDIAVIHVPGLRAEPLVRGRTVSTGTEGVFAGYPLGGPLRVRPAIVADVTTVLGADIYQGSTQPVEVYRLAARVQEGNSGGPLLTSTGEVVGLIFARSEDSDTVGFALTMAELEPVAAKAASLDRAVASGNCVG